MTQYKSGNFMLVVVLTVGWVTHAMRKKSALLSMTIGMLLMPISALWMAGGNLVGEGTIMWMHPIAFMMVIGICFQALAESFISPRSNVAATCVQLAAGTAEVDMR